MYKGNIGEIYNISCDEGMEYSVKDIAQILIRIIKGEDYENWLHIKQTKQTKQTTPPPPYRRCLISNNKLKSLGWTMTIDFLKGITELVNQSKK